MAVDEWLDVAASAERHGCSKSSWRRVWQGRLPARTEKVDGRDGRMVIKTLIRVSDLDPGVRPDRARRARPEDPPGRAAADAGADDVHRQGLHGPPARTGRQEKKRRGGRDCVVADAVPIFVGGGILCPRSRMPDSSFGRAVDMLKS